MTGQGMLFDAEPVPAEPRPKESAGVRRAKRQRAMLAAGRHPAVVAAGLSAAAAC